MAVGHATYLDVPIDQRRIAAKRVRDVIRTALGNPYLGGDQQASLGTQLERLTQWEHGKLPVGEPITVPSKS